MKKKVTMTCILKSGEVIKDTPKINMKDTQAVTAFRELQRSVTRSVGLKNPEAQNISFGTTTISTSEIAAIIFI